MTIRHPTRDTDILRLVQMLGIEASRIVEYRHGIAARNFHIVCMDGTTRVVRYDTRRTAADIREDRMLGTLAVRNGINAPTGNWLIHELGNATVVIRQHLAGTTLAELPPGTWPDAHRLGQVLRSIHELPQPLIARKFFYAPLLDMLDRQWQTIRDAVASIAETAELAALLRYALQQFDHAAEIETLRLSPIGLIHGDFTPANILIHEHGLTVLDWEKSCIGPVCADIAQSLYYCVTAHSSKIGTFATSFLEGYGKPDWYKPDVIKTWMTLHPAFILLTDAANTFLNQRLPLPARNPHREAYFRDVSVPRYRAYLTHQRDLLSIVS